MQVAEEYVDAPEFYYPHTPPLLLSLLLIKSSRACFVQVAEEYVDAPEFYYPHTLDFRGRAYPLHPSLHHLGDDSCRGLLLFAQGVPLGAEVRLAGCWLLT